MIATQSAASPSNAKPSYRRSRTSTTDGDSVGAKTSSKRGNASTAWEAAAREAAAQNKRELRRLSPREIIASTDDDTIEEGKVASFSALKLKFMAAKMRRKTQKQMTVSREPDSLDVDGSQAADRKLTDEEVLLLADDGFDNKAALASILVHPFSVLLLAFPLGLLSEFHHWGESWTFWLNLTALLPLAKILGDGTEELAAALKNDTISGLLNATLGNAVEMILCVQTLRKGLLDVVKATLLGSILSNILLVLGTSFLLGGLIGSNTTVGKHHVIYEDDYTPSRCTMEKEQIFSSKSAVVSMAMQLLSCLTFTLPTVFASDSMHDGEISQEHRDTIVKVSRLSAILIMAAYVAYILFQLVTHKRMLTYDEGVESDSEDEEVGGMSIRASLVLMAVTTGMIAISTENLVDAISEVVAKSDLSADFIGIILLPFAGNACEHASAVRFAIQDRPGLSLGIAVGSSTQMALFVVPFTVVMGWILDQPMDLVFGRMNTTVLILSVLVAMTLVMDGRANWLKGYMLCTAYLFEAVLYWQN